MPNKTMMKPITALTVFLSVFLCVLLSPLHVTYAADEVNVYSYRQSFLMEPIFAKFTEKTGIKVNLISASKGLVERIKAENKGSSADLLLTSNYSRLADAVDANITQDIPNNILDVLPPNLRDDNKQWIALTQRARLLYVSKTRVSKTDVQNYEDLAEPKWRGKICTRSGTHDYNLGLFGSFIHHWGEQKTEEWLRAVKINLARTPQGNDRAQVSAIHNGICDIAIGNSYYYGLMLQNDKQRAWAESVNLVFPNQKTGGTHMNISGTALLKYAPNADNAIKLMHFMLSDSIQQKYAEENFEYPALFDAKWSAEITQWGTFETDKAPLSAIYANRRKAFLLVNKVDFNSKK